MTTRWRINTYSRIRNPPICSHQRSGTEILVLVPPIAGARSAAACAQDTFVHPIKFLAILWRLKMLSLGNIVVLKVRLDGLVLLVEKGEVGYKVFHDIHCHPTLADAIQTLKTSRTVRQRVDLGVLPSVTVNSAQTSQRVLSVDVHCARAANPLSARTTESESRVNFVLDLDKSI